MTQTTQAEPSTSELSGRGRYALAALAIVPILATVYQTLVLTDVTDDVIRKGIEAEHYSMIWINLCWGISVIYGLFGAIWAMVRFGGRLTLIVGLILFALGNLLCGAATDLTTMAAARIVEGLGKGLTIAVCRALLYRQFDTMVIVAIGFYGVVAYATRPWTPLVTALINDALSWRWIYWVNVPAGFVGLVLVGRFIKPDRPPKPLPLRIDWLAVTLLVAWVVSLEFAFSWYRKWGGWTSNAFAVTALLCVLLPIVLTVWVAGGFTPDEHLKRIFRVRVYVLAMSVRMLLLLSLGAVLGLMGRYLTGLRDFPRETAGWLLAPAGAGMALTTILTTVFRRRSLRHVWLLVAVVGSAACLWWMSSLDNFTSKEQIALMMGCWGLFVGLLPPVFLTDEVEGLDRRDALYGGALAVVALILPLLIIPTVMGTIVSAFTDRALDVERLNLTQNRPEVEEAGRRIADYYQQHGVEGPELQQETSRVLGTFATLEAVSQGIQTGLRFLSVMVGGMGLLVTLLLFHSGPGPGAPLDGAPSR